jgi:CDP-glucose 4,6-dehydratase
MDFSIYKNKKVFLTGHTGFKGSWMLAWLHKLGATVKGFSLAPENTYDLYYSINGDSLCESIIADIRNKNKLETEIISFQPDFIFHLAAQPLVRLSYEIPSETFEVNAVGTAHVLDAVRKLQKECTVILITTDKVYENIEWHYPYRENDRLGGYDPYSASKACAEIVINSYRNSFFNINQINEHKKGIASARAGNVIGGGDWAKDRIIPDIVKALHKNESIIVRNPKSIRPWQHVLEPIAGYLHLGLKLSDNPQKYAEAWNFGPFSEDNLLVEDLVKKAIDIWGRGDYNTPNLLNQPHEAGLLKLDINKSVNELLWKPKWSAKQAIEKTLNWYKDSYVQSNTIELIYKNISEYNQ